ncbi:MAG: Holliday junction branch migration protein RuvA [Candidatus Omnitrophota bacterium]
MISRISGAIIDKKDGMFLIKAGNICYEVLVPIAVMKAIDKKFMEDNCIKNNEDVEPETKGQIELVTYHYYQMEPSRAVPVLIGFLNGVEKEFFEKFISVSGVGPKAACKALAEPFSKIADAIDSGDVVFLKKLPGIGEQRARLIVAKLQGKVGKFGLIQDRTEILPLEKYGNIKHEALEVLLQLQYRRSEAEEMIKKALDREPDLKTSEDLLNQVYKGRLVQ